MEQIKTLYRKLFDLRHSEVESVILFQIIFFLLLFCLLMVKPTASALFIAEFGADELPRAFILVAIVAAGVTQLIAWMNRYPITSVIKKTILLCATIFIAIGVLMTLGLFKTFTPYILFLWVSIFALVSTSQYWLLGNMIFNPDQAKRVFGLIGSGSIAGAALGGYFSSGISILGGATEISIFVGFILLICIPLTNRLITISTHIEPEFKSVKSENNFLEPFKFIKNSKLLKNIAFIVFLNVLVSKIIDYYFGVYAEKNYPDQDELSAFYGFTYSTYNIIGFAIQLFLTSKVIKKIGVSNTLIILPASILIAFFGLLLLPSLFFAVLLKLFDTSFKQSFQRSGIELTMIPVPQYVKAKVKPFIDVFIDSFATGIAGLLLIFLTATALNEYGFILGFGILFAITWIILTHKIKSVYLEYQSVNHSFSNIEPDDILTPAEFKSTLHTLIGEQKIDELRKVLKSGIKFDGLGVDEELISIYQTGNEQLQLAIMKFLYLNPENYIPFNLKEEIFQVKNPELKQSILSYAVISDDYKDKDIYALLDENDWKIQTLTIFALVKYYGRSPYLEQTIHVTKNASLLLDKAIESEEYYYVKQCLAIIAMYKTTGYEDVLKSHLHGHSKIIKKACIEVIPLTKESKFLELLFSLKLLSSLNLTRIKAISEFKDVLINYVEQRQGSMKISHLILTSKALGYLPTQASVNMLLGLMVHPNRKLNLVAVEQLSQLLLKNKNLSFIEELVTKQIVEDCKLIEHLDKINSTLKTTSYLQHKVNDQTLCFWLSLRTSELIDLTFLKVFHLIGIIIPDTDFDQIYRQLKRINKRNNPQIPSELEKSIPTQLFGHVKKAISIVHGPKQATKPLKIKSEKQLINQILKIRDKKLMEIIFKFLEDKNSRQEAT